MYPSERFFDVIMTKGGTQNYIEMNDQQYQDVCDWTKSRCANLQSIAVNTVPTSSEMIRDLNRIENTGGIVSSSMKRKLGNLPENKKSCIRRAQLIDDVNQMIMSVVCL